MRFAFATLLALATTAAAGVIARDETNVGVTIAVASPEQLTSCKCLKDNFGDTGVHISQDLTSYQCAYPNGACTWSKSGTLQNTAQTNCPTTARCIIAAVP